MKEFQLIASYSHIFLFSFSFGDQFKSNRKGRMSVAPFKLNTSPIDEETRQVAEKELNETPERVASAVAELRALLQAATDLHYFDDEDFLITFLRPCHFYPESALNLVSQTSNGCFQPVSVHISVNKLWLQSPRADTTNFMHYLFLWYIGSKPRRLQNIYSSYYYYYYYFLCYGFSCYLTRTQVDR